MRVIVSSVCTLDVDVADLAAALDQAEDRALAGRAACRACVGACVAATSLVAEVRFVRLDRPAAAAERAKAAVAHRLADAVAHEPCGLEVTPRMRWSWWVLMPFLERASR